MAEVDVQMDVFAVLKLIEEEGEASGAARHLRVNVGLDVSRGGSKYEYAVRNSDEIVATFYSQIECRAFVEGYELALKSAPPSADNPPIGSTNRGVQDEGVQGCECRDDCNGCACGCPECGGGG